MSFSQRQIDFVAWILPHAKRGFSKSKVNPHFMVAQAALESGWGKHSPGNMLFGIKANSSYKGPRQLLTTWECGRKPKLQPGERVIKVLAPGQGRCKSKTSYQIKAWFRKYSSPLGSLADHAGFLRRNKRYRKAFNYSKDAAGFAKEVAKAGYATAPSYASTLIKVIGWVKSIERGLRSGKYKAKSVQPHKPSSGQTEGPFDLWPTATLFSIGIYALGGYFIYKHLLS